MASNVITFNDVEYNPAAPDGIYKYKMNQKSITFRNAKVFVDCLQDDLQVNFASTKNSKSWVFPPQVITHDAAGNFKTANLRIMFLLEHFTLQLSDTDAAAKPYVTLVAKQYPPGDIEYQHLVEETIQEGNAIWALMDHLMTSMIPSTADGVHYKKMRFRNIMDFKIKLNFPLQKGVADKTQVSEFNNLLAITSNNSNPRKHLALQIMGGWILPPAIDTQDVDDIRWNTVGVTFQVYPWSCSPLGKPRPPPAAGATKRKLPPYVPVEVAVQDLPVPSEDAVTPTVTEDPQDGAATAPP